MYVRPRDGTLVYNFLPPGHETKSKSGAETRKRDSIQPCTTYPSCPHRGRCPSPPTRACLALSKSVDISVEDARRSLSRSFLISRFDDDEKKKSGARSRPVYERTRPRRENRTRSPREPKHATPQSCKSERGRGGKGDGEGDLLHHHHCCRPLPANNRPTRLDSFAHQPEASSTVPPLCESFFVARRTVTPLANRTFIKSIKKD